MAIVAMLLEDVALGAEIETRVRLVSARKQHRDLLWRDRPTQGKGFRAVRAQETQWLRQKDRSMSLV